MKRKSPAFRFIVIITLGGLFATSSPVAGEPFLPDREEQVLERLRPVAFDPAARELRTMRTALAADPCDATLAAAFVRRCLERCRAEGDPRHLGRAQAALAPWWTMAAPPVEVLVLRATLKQSQHDFTNALADLDAAIKLDPNNAQAWLTRATVLTVLGRYEEARQACRPLARLAPGLVAVTAAATIHSLTGGAERSCELLRGVLTDNATAGPAEKLWAWTVFAETAARLGRPAEAEAGFRHALRLGQRDVYLLGAFADFLLDQRREREAADLLKDEVRTDSLLLRLCLAEAAQSPAPASLSPHVDALRARFEASRLRGDSIHQREEARFTLGLLHQPDAALQLALANWRVQREPADARILLEAALASGQPTAAAPVIEFVQQHRLEDAHLTQLIKRLNPLAAR